MTPPTRDFLVIHDAFAWPALEAHLAPIAVLELEDAAQSGANGAWLPGRRALRAIHGPDGEHPADGLALSLEGPDPALDAGNAQVWAQLRARCPGLPATLAAPLLLVRLEAQRARGFHLAHTGPAGGLYLAYGERPGTWSADGAGVAAAAAALHPFLAERAHLLGDGAAYWKWRPDLELERKFTFRTAPDTWSLIVDLYQEVRSGGLPHFVPESGMEFQVFDYESILFDVRGTPGENGYVSFIPQADGQVAVKRKWFEQNAELRRESVDWGKSVALDRLDEAAAAMTGGYARRLCEFRRKRFDINFESLETGHVFGIYFDICRDVGEPSLVMSQCEVEYCRTRSLAGVPDVFEEFERVCAFTRRFLEGRRIEFEHNLYSKLDFSRECHAARSSGAAA